ncbi:MAG: hypothetical protein RLZZ303_2803 [Candidatus Hydrogenedentota bacterium]
MSRWKCATMRTLLLALLLPAAPAMAEWAEQTLDLQPGWNAVYLEVQPDDNTCASVFQDVPIESVWYWNKSFDPRQFTRNPSELRPESPDWLTYFPVDSPKSFLTDLYAVHGGRCYLIELGSSSPVQLTLTGKMVIRKLDWLPDALNLVGFQVDAASPPTFKTFFGGDKALDGQAIYRIKADGMAEEVTNKDTATMRSGEAYWVYCKGESTYSGPLTVDYDIADGLQFGDLLNEQTLRLTNSGTTERIVTLRMLPAAAPVSKNKDATLPALAGPVALSYLEYLKWKPLEEPLRFVMPPNSQQQVELGVRRADMPSAGEGKAWYASLLEVSDGIQTYRLPVSAEKLSSEGGLWAGTVTVTKVSEAANPTNLTVPTTSSGDFNFRIIVHIDGTGTARLLQSVAMMQVQPVVNQQGEVTTPSRYVLVTDESKIPQFTGVAMRDGEVVGRRITAPVFSFRQPLTMTEPSPDVLEVDILTDYQDSTNPFLHRFHPDHDNLTERYEATPLPEGFESYSFIRKVRLEFQDQDPEALDLPNWGYDLIGGTYKERISGVHRNDIYVQGTFQLTRVSDVLELNDGQ